MSEKCGHVERAAIHPSIKVGGVSVGKCEREVLPRMTVCEEHATRDALAMNIRWLAKANDELCEEVLKLRERLRMKEVCGWEN